MTSQRRIAALASAALVAGVAAAPAHAAVTRTTLGTGTDVGTVTNNFPAAAGAADGSAIVAWAQKDAGTTHLFASRFINGAWTAKTRIDTGIATEPSPPVVGIGTGGKAVIAFASGPAAAEKLYLVSASSNAAAFGAPAQVGADTGWKQLDLEVGSTGNGYLSAHKLQKLYAFRITDGAATKVQGPSFDGTLNFADTGDASGNAPKQANVGVDATGSIATIGWSEQDAGLNDHAYARRITGTAVGDVGAAIQADVPNLEGAAAATFGNDELSVATGGPTTWVAFRENFNYVALGANKARSLVRSFDGTKFGPAYVIDAQPLDPTKVTDGAENPIIAVDAAGHGVAVSSGQGDNLTHASKLTGTSWSPGTIIPDTSTVPRVAMTAAGTGLSVLTPASATNTLTAKITNGPADGTSAAINDATQGPIFSGTGTAAAGNSGVVLYRQGQAADGKIIVANVDLPAPPTPTPTPTPTPGPGGGSGGTTPIVPTFSKLGLSSSRIKRADRKPIVLTPGSKGPYLELTLDRAARVTLTAERASKGRKSAKGECVKPTRANAKRKSCTRYVSVSTAGVFFDRPAGITLIRFTGRLGGKHALPAGTYRLNVTAADAATGALTTIKRLAFTLR